MSVKDVSGATDAGPSTGPGVAGAMRTCELRALVQPLQPELLQALTRWP